jgi:hypothetical protein
MLLANIMAAPISLTVAIWSLRSVPISLLVLMFVFNSGSIHDPQANLHFWFDAIAISGIIGIVTYWNHLHRLHWNGSVTLYLYIFLVLLLRNPFGILTGTPQPGLQYLDAHSIVNSLSVGIGILAIGMLLEVLIFHLRQFKVWAWWLAVTISILYVSSIIFFCSGTLGIWSLLDPDTKQSFRQRMRKLGNR